MRLSRCARCIGRLCATDEGSIQLQRARTASVAKRSVDNRILSAHSTRSVAQEHSTRRPLYSCVRCTRARPKRRTGGRQREATRSATARTPLPLFYALARGLLDVRDVRCSHLFDWNRVTKALRNRALAPRARPRNATHLPAYLFLVPKFRLF